MLLGELMLQRTRADLVLPVYRAVTDAYPTAAALADADPEDVQQLVRPLGLHHRLPRLQAAAEAVRDGVPTREQDLLAVPGVGPYATAQMLMLLGRYSRLILDSWSRPKYAKLHGRKASDKTIERRFRRYKRYAGLAFWLYVTRDWVAEPAGIK